PGCPEVKSLEILLGLSVFPHPCTSLEFARLHSDGLERAYPLKHRHPDLFDSIRFGVADWLNCRSIFPWCNIWRHGRGKALAPQFFASRRPAAQRSRKQRVHSTRSAPLTGATSERIPL